MIFNDTGVKPRNLSFKVREKEFRIANRYKYPCTTLLASGSFIATMENLSARAIQAYLTVRKVLNEVNFAPKVALKFFDSFIKPFFI